VDSQTRTMRPARSLLVAALASAVLAGGCGRAVTSSSTDGATLVSQLCARCHPIDRVKAARKDRSGWTSTVTRMRVQGLQVNDAQAAAIVGYLTQRDGGQ
jgi:hypothetical protein